MDLIQQITIGITVVGNTFSGEEIRGEVLGYGTKNGKQVIDIRSYKDGAVHWLYNYQIKEVIYE